MSVAGYVIAVLVVAAIAGFVIYRLRAVRREGAAPVAAGDPNRRTGADRG
jgi:hypothetical protein